MNLKAFLLLAACLGILSVGVRPLYASTIQYDVNLTVGTIGSVTGYIATDGTIGPLLHSSEIIDWDLSLNDGTRSIELKPSFSVLAFQPGAATTSALNATPTTLSYNFDFGPGGSYFYFYFSAANALVCLTDATVGCGIGGVSNLSLYYAPNSLNTSEAGNGSVVIGRAVGVVPVPAALPLFATGLAGMGWLARRRRKQAAA